VLDRRGFFDELPGLAQLGDARFVIGTLLGDALSQPRLHSTARLRRLLLQRFDLGFAFALDGLGLLIQLVAPGLETVLGGVELGLELGFGLPDRLVVLRLQLGDLRFIGGDLPLDLSVDELAARAGTRSRRAPLCACRRRDPLSGCASVAAAPLCRRSRLIPHCRQNRPCGYLPKPQAGHLS
jgi:hypothetical protein